MSPQPAPRPTGQPLPAEQHTGISNRESATEEQAERQAHPPIDPGPPPPEDAAGRVGDAASATFDGGQASHKAGSRAAAQKEDPSTETTRKASGAFGKEPKG
jgi:hypothetical protein